MTGLLGLGNSHGKRDSEDGGYLQVSQPYYNTQPSRLTLPFRFHVPTNMVHCFVVEYSANLQQHKSWFHCRLKLTGRTYSLVLLAQNRG